MTGEEKTEWALTFEVDKDILRNETRKFSIGLEAWHTYYKHTQFLSNFAWIRKFKWSELNRHIWIYDKPPKILWHFDDDEENERRTKRKSESHYDVLHV